MAGSVALDTRSGPWGEVQEELGGSAIYFALAASLLLPVEVIAAAGRDAEDEVRGIFAGRDIDLEGLAILDAPTYRWHAHQVDGVNHETGSNDAIYDAWQPTPPASFRGWAFVGSMRPQVQLQAAQSLAGAGLVAGDSMRSYVTGAPEEAVDFVRACSWFFCNEEELEAMGGERTHPEAFRREFRLEGLCVKRGRLGASIHTGSGSLSLRAPTRPSVVDTTGAGDALAGGFLASWLSSQGEPDALQEALVYGVACASLAIESIGARRLASAQRSDLEARVREVRRGL